MAQQKPTRESQKAFVCNVLSSLNKLRQGRAYLLNISFSTVCLKS